MPPGGDPEAVAAKAPAEVVVVVWEQRDAAPSPEAAPPNPSANLSPPPAEKPAAESAGDVAEDAPDDDLDGPLLSPFLRGERVEIDNSRSKTLHGKSGRVERVPEEGSTDEHLVVVSFVEAEIKKGGSEKKFVSKKLKRNHCRVVEWGPVRKKCAWK